jgi:5-methyltetrahydropteroyltriglutamate--homocysteine methyltransferase
VTIQQNTDRIQTTHIGSLPRPHDRARLMKAKFAGQPYDQKLYDATITKAVADSVRKQVECGIDIVTDGEVSKPGFFTYIQERLEGFEPRPKQKMLLFQQEVAAFPEYYAQYFKDAMMGGAIVPLSPVVCVGPVKYRGEKYLQTDIDNVKAAAKAAGVPDHHVFLPATAPSGVGINEYYKSEEDYFHALAAELNRNTRRSSRRRHFGAGRRPLPARYLLRARPRRRAEEAARRDLCRGHQRALKAFRPRWCASTPATASTKGRASTKPPRRHHRLHAQDQRRLLQLRGANPRHEHEYHLFERDQGPGRQGALPRHDHPRQQHRRASELIAERIMRYTKLVGART